MSTVGFGRLERRPGGHRSHSGTSGNFLKTMQRPGGTPRERAESDTALLRQALLLQLALKALDRVIAEYCGATHGRRPSYAALAQYLEERERGLETVPASGTGAKVEIPALLQPQARAAAG
jgi:hypothetical protein